MSGGTDLGFPYSCNGCGQQSFQISMDGYRVDKALCNVCGTVVHFSDRSTAGEPQSDIETMTAGERQQNMEVEQ